MRRSSTFVLVACLSCLLTTIPATAATVQAVGDASIARNSLGTWTVGAGGALLTIVLDRARDYRITSLAGPWGTNWIQAAGADTIVTVDGVEHVFGSHTDGFAFTSINTQNDGRHLQLDIAYTLQPQNLLVTRHIAVVSGSPTFEVWNSFQAQGDSVSIDNINAVHGVIANGMVHWLTGHKPASGDNTLDSAFARQDQTLDAGDTLSLGSGSRSSEVDVPWLAVDGESEEFYSGLMWSGSWALTLNGTAAGLSMDWGLAPMATEVAATVVEGPHLLLGVANGSLAQASAALRSYVIDGVRDGRPLSPLVTYNTWFAYGTDVTDGSMRREMARVAAMGVELFVLDAGWYLSADTRHTGDFGAGLGTWVPDPDRFPDGLKPLADYAHSLGMKFGLWLEPERVSLSVIGQSGLEEPSLAKAAGSYQSANSAQICLAGEAGRQWMVDRINALIDDAQPDYIKWDNNLWVNCERDGHGHGPSDGNFAHVTALYHVLASLRAKYPSLLIENCSSGGNRMDFGMLRYTDVAWMDDRTAPSSHVRHNINGLGVVFPPAYLLSFLTDLDWEPLHDSPDLALYVRSRMEGVLGLCFQSASLSDADLDAIASQVELYKELRPTQALAAASLLSPQADVFAGPAWDVLQESAADGSLLLYAFDSYNGANAALVTPTALQPDVVYRVISVDSGTMGDRTGAELMETGIRLVRSPGTAAHVLSLVPQP
jgi:alpha-galactosidase